MCAKRNDSSWRININDGLLLYYNQYSFYSQKVLLALYEKNIPFESQIIDLTKSTQYEPWFLQLNPRGEVPLLKDSGRIISDSARIIDYLEDQFCIAEVPKLIPMDSHETRQRATYYRHILDQIPAGIITMGSFFHPELVDKPKAPFLAHIRKKFINVENTRSETLKLQAKLNPKCAEILLQKLEFHEKRHQIVIDKNEFMNVLSLVEDVLDKVEEELASHRNEQENWWLCSNTFTVADISLTVLLERLNQLGFEYTFWKNGRRPCIEKYYERVKTRPSFKKAIPDTLFYIKVFLKSQKPVALGCAVMAGIAFIIGGYFIIKKIM